jgi:RimJ/RimL family protein N-acetyltransferase
VTSERPLGEELDWQPVEAPARVALEGTSVRLEPLDPDAHGDSLHDAGRDPRIWEYLPYGPFGERAAFDAYLGRMASTEDPLAYAIVEADSGRALGVATYLRIEPLHGVIEIGHIWMAPELQRTRPATEAIYLLARHVFDELGYRRLEWKCNALNAASCRAAERFGFTAEGVFRNHLVVKGRNRDTSWYAITDSEWPAVRAGFDAWLDASNFDGHGRQLRRLADLR